MIIRNLLNNQTATEADYIFMNGIGAGIYCPIRLEQVGSVTSITLIFSRNGAQEATAVVTPYEGAVLDISMMAAATPSITESINAGLGFTDFVDSVSIQYMEGTLKSITIRVIHASAAYAIAYVIKRDGIKVPNQYNEGGVASTILTPEMVQRITVEVSRIVRAEILTILTKKQ